MKDIAHNTIKINDIVFCSQDSKFKKYIVTEIKKSAIGVKKIDKPLSKLKYFTSKQCILFRNISDNLQINDFVIISVDGFMEIGQICHKFRNNWSDIRVDKHYYYSRYETDIIPLLPKEITNYILFNEI